MQTDRSNRARPRGFSRGVSHCRRRRARCPADERPEQTGLLGILSVLLVLIPALLLMAHVTEYSAIHVSVPRYGGDQPNDGVRYCGGPTLEVTITHDGFYTRMGGAPWRRAGARAGRYDHEALEAVVREYTRLFPHETVATISAEASIPYGTVVATLDTVRGPSCRLAGALAGEAIPEDCLLWQPILRDRAPNHDVPAFRRYEAWPPRAPQRLEPGQG